MCEHFCNYNLIFRLCVFSRVFEMVLDSMYSKSCIEHGFSVEFMGLRVSSADEFRRKRTSMCLISTCWGHSS